MAHAFDPGYGAEPYRTLCSEYPGSEVYPTADFRTEWGPVFHRGRLDGTARVLVVGQDPAQHEVASRRILIGEAGQRTQGFLKKLGIDRSYVMINTFLYSVYGQQGGQRHRNDPAITAYRHRWLDAVFAHNHIEAVVSLGALADGAYRTWKATATGRDFEPAYAHITHPTQPESSAGGNAARRAAAVKALLKNWNSALAALKPTITHPDATRPLVLYGNTFKSGDVVEIPEADLPAGLPAWMRGVENWAKRTGRTAAIKRVTITITIPAAFRP